MTKQQMLNRSNDQVKSSKAKDVLIFLGFALLVVVPFVTYLTNQLAK